MKNARCKSSYQKLMLFEMNEQLELKMGHGEQIKNQTSKTITRKIVIQLLGFDSDGLKHKISPLGLSDPADLRYQSNT